ncbi:MAG: universal stress protein [Spartobacteria bacterium]
MKKTTIKTILVPIDFSELSLGAIATAQNLAQRFGATIHLVHVHEFPYAPGLLAPIPITVMDYRDDAATRRLRRLHGLAKRNGLSPENCHFLNGAPTFREICALARELPADLIVMPTHGSTGLARFLGGSTAERIVQHAPCPVLVVRKGETGLRRKASDRKASINLILVPVDFSQPSFQALEYAIEFAGRVAARILVYHAVPLGGTFTADGYAMYDLTALEEAARAGAESQMQKFTGLAKFGRIPYETIVDTAAPIAGICALAKERNVDLIITPTHGRTGFKHLLLGSVAELVVRHACRPVLVVPTHPDVRVARLTKLSVPVSRPAPSVRKKRAPVRAETLTKKKRKLVASAFPERRRTNRFRESHAAPSYQ